MIPRSVTFIGIDAFGGCEGLEAINVEEGNPNYSSIDGVLYNKDKTTLIKAPDCLTGVFTIPEGVTVLGCARTGDNQREDEWYNWSGFGGQITGVYIPLSVKTIEECCFWGCYELTDVYYAGTAKDFKKVNVGEFNDELIFAEWHYSSKQNTEAPAQPIAPGINEFIIDMSVNCMDDFIRRVSQNKDYGNSSESAEALRMLNDYCTRCRNLSVASIFTASEPQTKDSDNLFSGDYSPFSVESIREYYYYLYSTYSGFKHDIYELGTYLTPYITGSIEHACPPGWTSDVNVIMGSPETTTFIWIIITKNGDRLKAEYVVLDDYWRSILQYWDGVRQVNGMGYYSELSFTSPYGQWSQIGIFSNIGSPDQ